MVALPTQCFITKLYDVDDDFIKDGGFIMHFHSFISYTMALYINLFFEHSNDHIITPC